MSKKTVTLDLKTHGPAIALAAILVLGITMKAGLYSFVIMASMAVAFFLNKETLYKVCPESWYVDKLKVHPDDFPVLESGRTMRPYYYVKIVGIAGTLFSLLVPTALNHLVFTGSEKLFGPLLGYLLFFALYHAALASYGEKYGMASTRARLAKQNEQDAA